MFNGLGHFLGTIMNGAAKATAQGAHNLEQNASHPQQFLNGMYNQLQNRVATTAQNVQHPGNIVNNLSHPFTGSPVVPQWLPQNQRGGGTPTPPLLSRDHLFRNDLPGTAVSLHVPTFHQYGDTQITPPTTWQPRAQIIPTYYKKVDNGYRYDSI